jgi:uncharacterized membrane protein
VQSTIVTRSGWDRVRYAVLFEAILIVAMGAILAMLSEQSMAETGVLAIILSVIAMIVSVVFNEIYDRVDAHYGRVPTARSFRGRALHAVAFESVLVIVSMPFIMWWMDWGFWETLAFDIAAMAGVVMYTFVFTLAYDKLFPVAQAER